MVNRVTTAAGIVGKRGAHRGRYTFAKVLRAAGVSLRDIQRSLGHSDITTIVVYQDEGNDYEAVAERIRAAVLVDRRNPAVA